MDFLAGFGDFLSGIFERALGDGFNFFVFMFWTMLVYVVAFAIKNGGLGDKKKITPESEMAAELFNAASNRWDTKWVFYGLVVVLCLYQSIVYFDEEVKNYVDSEISNLEGDISNLEDEITNLGDEISNLEYDISTHQHHNHAWLGDEITNLEGKISNLAGDISNLAGDISNLEYDISTHGHRW